MRDTLQITVVEQYMTIITVIAIAMAIARIYLQWNQNHKVLPVTS